MSKIATLDDLKIELWLRQRELDNIVWTTKNGDKISIRKMSNNQLINALMKNTILTDNDKEFISQIVCDDATGNHLLGRKRQEGYWEMRKEIVEAKNSESLTERQIDILEYYKQSSDYTYYQSLPIEKRMF